MEVVTLKFNHGGRFLNSSNGLLYVGGRSNTFDADPNEISGFELEALVARCGNYDNNIEIFYLIPGFGLKEGLRTAFHDSDVRVMAELAQKHKSIELFVFHRGKGPDLLVNDDVVVWNDVEGNNFHKERPKTLSPKKVQIAAKQPNSPRCKAKESTNSHKSLTKVTTTLGPTEVTCTPPNLTQQSIPILTNPTSNTLSTPCVDLFPIEAQTQVESQIILPSFHTFEVPSNYEWEDSRPDEVLPWVEFLAQNLSDDGDASESNSDDDYRGESDDESLDRFVVDEEVGEDLNVVECEEEVDDEGGLEPEIPAEEDTSDEEGKIARERVKGYNQSLINLRKQLLRDAGEGRFSSQTQIQLSEGPGNQDSEGVFSEYEDSDEEIHTPPESGEDETLTERRAKRSTIVGVNTDWSTFKWEVGQRFASRDLFKKAVAKFAIIQGRNLTVGVSDKNRGQRLGVKCKGGCPFRVYASVDSRRGTYLVKSVKGEHNCSRNMEKNTQLKSSWCAEQLLEVFKARPHWPAKDIIEAIRLAYKVMIKRDFAYKVKQYAHQKLHGSMRSHYNNVARYLEAIRLASPNNDLDLVSIQKSKKNPPIFERLYVCFDGLKKGWIEGCRKLICIDSCFIKTFLGVQRMSAVGRDGNDQMFPIAWAVVEGENNSSWAWFLQHLQNSLQLQNEAGISFVSDEHQSILSGVKEVFPDAQHIHCARHIFSHWHKNWKGDEFKALFWQIVKSYNIGDYDAAMDELIEFDEDAADEFKAHDPKVFCRVHLGTTTKTNVVTNNMAETFNSYIINARSKHLIDMLEEIRVLLMQRIVQKRREVEKWSTMISPRVLTKLEKSKDFASKCQVLPSTHTLFQVNMFCESFIVDIEARSCSCRRWNLTGVPCSHGVASIFFCHQKPEDYVDAKYTRAMYLKAYGGSIPPLDGEKLWPRLNSPLDPTPIKVGPGRPRNNRRKDPSEDPKRKGKLTRHGIEMTCTICKKKGHNKRKCPNKGTTQPTEPQPKRPKGRPRKDGQPPRTNGYSATDHLSVIAAPTLIGRGGRTVRGGRGSRGGGSGGRGSRGGGRRANQVPRGVGVLFGSDGTVYTNDPTTSGPTVLNTAIVMSSAPQPSTQGYNL